MIIAQSLLPGISVSQVAQCYDVNADQVFNWCTDLKLLQSGQMAANSS